MQRLEWDANDYEKHSSAQQQWARELIEKLGLQGHEALLDIGCGDGKVTAEIAARLPRGLAVGIDNSKAMVTLARNRYPASEHHNLQFQLADARALPFRDEFDAVFSNAVLHWVRDHRPVLQGIAASLRIGGTALLQMGGRGNADDVLSVLDELLREEEWRPFFVGFAMPYGFYGPEEYQVWLAEAGLAGHRVELKTKDMTYADRTGFEGWIRTTWHPYTHRVPPERRGELIARVADRYLERHRPDERGVLHVRMVRLEVEAGK